MRYGPDYNKEIECCRKAIELAPKYATPWNNMGTAYYHLGNYQKAVECFRKAVELEPGDKVFQRNLEIAKEEL